MIDTINFRNKALLDKYLMVCRRKGLTERTIEAKTFDLTLFLRFIGNMELKDVTHLICDDFLMHCQSDRNNGDWALNRKHSSLSALYDTLIKKEYLPSNMVNPMFKVDKTVVRRRIKDYLTVDEIDQVKQYLQCVGDKRGLALWMLMYSSACRISEIHQLNRSSLNFCTREFLVTGKGQKQRICFFSGEAAECVQQYLESRTDNLEPLFISRECNRWSKRGIQHFVQEAVKQVGINKHITPHSLRHSILTNLRLNGALLEDLQLLAGHSSIQTTQSTYTHVGLEDIRHKFDKFHELSL